MARQGRRGQRKTRGAGRFKQPPWRRISNPYKPIEVLREEQVKQIHEASLTVLEDLGLEFLDDQALDILDKAGADVDHKTKLVRFDRGLITQSIATAPSQFTIHARNPARNIIMGGNHVNFSPVGSRRTARISITVGAPGLTRIIVIFCASPTASISFISSRAIRSSPWTSPRRCAISTPIMATSP